MDVLSPNNFSYKLELTMLLRYNEALRLQERRHTFKVSELQRWAAQSVSRNLLDLVSFIKIGEGAANRVFLVTFRDGFKMIAKIPYPATGPKGLVVASEAATMAFLHSRGLPVPKVYGYSACSENAAGTEYIFMEFFQGQHLSDIWCDLDTESLRKLISSLVELEARLMNISLPAFGSLYFQRDIPNGTESVAVDPGDTNRPDSFFVGPSTALHLWHGKRQELSMDRGPCKCFILLRSVQLLTAKSPQAGSRTQFWRRERNLLSHSIRPTLASLSENIPGTLWSRKAATLSPPHKSGKIHQNSRAYDSAINRVIAASFETP